MCLCVQFFFEKTWWLLIARVERWLAGDDETVEGVIIVTDRWADTERQTDRQTGRQAGKEAQRWTDEETKKNLSQPLRNAEAKQWNGDQNAGSYSSDAKMEIYEATINFYGCSGSRTTNHSPAICFHEPSFYFMFPKSRSQIIRGLGMKQDIEWRAILVVSNIRNRMNGWWIHFLSQNFSPSKLHQT